MKHYIIIALATASILLAGCDSDSSTSSSECNADEVKADCSNGKYSKCVDGKWTETTCDNNASCKADGSCGECKDGENKSDCSEGKYSKCIEGKWTETTCENNASCKADGSCGECVDGETKDCVNDGDSIGQVTICTNGAWSSTKQACSVNGVQVSCDSSGKCGECITGDSKNCENDSKTTVGKAILCKDGKWAATAENCPNLYSCSVEDECYKCHNKCDDDYTCVENCESCETSCIHNAECKTKCGVCESKCGECLDKDGEINTNKDCKDDTNGVGSATFCINGTWTEKKCSYFKAVDVSCYKYCPEGNSDCNETEKESVCGMCPNTEGHYLCLAKDNAYGWNAPYLEQRVECENGVITSVKPCQQNTCNQVTGACAPEQFEP